MTDKNRKQNEREIIIDQMPARACSIAQNKENVLYPLQATIINNFTTRHRYNSNK